ncbi:MAG: hypothetical protein EA396_06665 [Anaerolineaceae bacterium]|nr:MAG: hypothetical protein EA396_06665 [Anaerolineaceae bacterium]
MRFRSALMCCVAAVLAACATSEPANPPRLSIVPFPTATAGAEVVGALPAEGVRRAGLDPVAIAPPTATAIPETCPPINGAASLPDTPPDDIADGLREYLNDGGAPDAIADVLRDAWDALGEHGFLRADVDLTGGGTAEIVAGYRAESGGYLVILGCEEGRYLERYRAHSPDRPPDDDAPPAPRLINITDMNLNNRPEVAFALTECEGERCEYRTQVVSWQAAQRRFVGLIGGGILSGNLPELLDTDDDQILEIVVRLTALGDINTGPLRTGVKIYDWDGTEYVLSIVQPEPLRYQIQVIHEADRNLAAGRLPDAARLYQNALSDENLRVWLRNEEENLETYALYRLMIARVAEGHPDAPAIAERINALFPQDAIPDESEAPADDVPVYVALARVFWTAYNATGSVEMACGNVRRAIEQTYGAAVDFLNRYGSRNPTYTIRDLCPF